MSNDHASIELAILPSPKHIELKQGNGIHPDNIVNIRLENTQQPVLGKELKHLPLNSSREGISLVLRQDETDTKLTHKEGYRLEVKNDQIEIVARTEAGLFYGAQTLNQMLEDAREQNLNIPLCSISDYPDIDYRGVHLDLKHHLDHTKYYYDYIDRLAKYKINAIIVEFEDKIRYEKLPMVGAMQSICIDEWAAISNYARERNIEISPLVQGLGHADFILKHKEFHAIRENKHSDWTCCPSNEKTYEMQFALYEDAIRATPHGKYVHIGGDEVSGLGHCPLCKKTGKTGFQLQMDWLTRVCDFVKKQGRTPIFWDDMVFKSAGNYRATYDRSLSEEEAIELWNKGEQNLAKEIQRFPKDCIYMRWNYENPELPGNIKAMDWYQKNGLKVMAATAAQCTENVMPRFNGRVNYIHTFSKLTKEKDLYGILCTAWDDASPHIETHWRGYIAQAEYGWSTDKRNEEEFNKVYRQREFGYNAAKFPFQNELGNCMGYWEQCLLDKGIRMKMWINHGHYEHIALPDETKPGAWAEKYKVRLDSAVIKLEQYKKVKSQIASMRQSAIRNQYTLEFFNAINEYQVFSPQLLLALKDYDMHRNTESKDALQKLLTKYEKVRADLEKVYSKTRKIHKGVGYELTMNHHGHIANRTVDGSWITMIEADFVEGVKAILN
jgi:N-acetyl-beta-hexosaminidase